MPFRSEWERVTQPGPESGEGRSIFALTHRGPPFVRLEVFPDVHTAHRSSRAGVAHESPEHTARRITRLAGLHGSPDYTAHRDSRVAAHGSPGLTGRDSRVAGTHGAPGLTGRGSRGAGAHGSPGLTGRRGSPVAGAHRDSRVAGTHGSPRPAVARYHNGRLSPEPEVGPRSCSHTPVTTPPTC
jgi:hypothetical protein